MNSLEAMVYLAGGLALFVYGLKLFSGHCRRNCGKHIIGWLYLYSDNRFRGACIGIPTTLSQPYPGASAALVANMGEAGLLPVRHTIGILAGMWIGGALIVEAFAFDAGIWALALVVVGAAGSFLAPGSRLSTWGGAALSVGLTLYGLAVMKTGAGDVMRSPGLAGMTGQFERISTNTFSVFLLGGIAGAAFRSWPVAVAVGMSFGVSVTAGIPFCLGASVGAATVGLPTGFCAAHFGRRLAMANLMMTVLSASLFMLILSDFTEVMGRLSAPGEAADPHAVAHAAVMYAALSTLIFMPLAPVVAALVSSIAVSGVQPATAPEAIDLDDQRKAIEEARRQTLRAGKTALAALRRNLSSFLVDPHSGDRDIRAACARVEISMTAVRELLRRLDIDRISDADLQKRNRLAAIAHNVACASEVISRDLAEMAREKTRRQVEFATEAAQEFEAYHRFVADEFEGAIERLDDSRLETPKDVPGQPALSRRETLLWARIYSDSRTARADAGIDLVFRSASSSLTTILHCSYDILSLLGEPPPKHFRYPA